MTVSGRFSQPQRSQPETRTVARGWLPAGPQGWTTRVALAAAAAPACFFTVMMVLGLVTPGYNWVARIGSELSLGSLGWIMIANFIALGAVELALAAALGRTIGDRASGRVATAAIGLLGAAFVVAGVCVTDPHKLVSGAHTWHGVVHSLMAVVIFFIATPVAGFAMARRLRHQRRFARFSALTAVATPALLIATFVTGSLLGLAERVVIAVALAWLTSLAIWLRRGHLASLDPSPQPSWRFRCARCWCGAGGDGFKLNMIRPHRPRAGHERLSGLITATASPGPAYRLRRRHRQGLPSREDG